MPWLLARRSMVNALLKRDILIRGGGDEGVIVSAAKRCAVKITWKALSQIPRIACVRHVGTAHV